MASLGRIFRVLGDGIGYSTGAHALPDMSADLVGGNGTHTQHDYRISPVKSHGYYKFQVEISAATNQNFYIEITCKA